MMASVARPLEPRSFVAADRPAEERGLTRDGVRLMVASPDSVADTTFRHLPEFLAPGDLLVVNTSPTMAAAIPGNLRQRDLVVHFSTPLNRRRWVIELRFPEGQGPILDAQLGDVIDIPGGTIRLDEAADGGGPGSVRLWRSDVEFDGGVQNLMHQHGRPIRYGYTSGEWPLSMYQTMFADRRRWPGSAEMPSAGRPFTPRVVRALRKRGVRLAAIELHAGVSSQESHEMPQPERFSVSHEAAQSVNETHSRGGRVIAVGTTVTRALESAVTSSGVVVASAGWTDLVVESGHRPRAVDGLITGWHPPEASHLDMLRAVGGESLVAQAYDRALADGYLWHEFGDSCLLLGDPIAA